METIVESDPVVLTPSGAPLTIPDEQLEKVTWETEGVILDCANVAPRCSERLEEMVQQLVNWHKLIFQRKFVYPWMQKRWREANPDSVFIRLTNVMDDMLIKLASIDPQHQMFQRELPQYLNVHRAPKK
jgi:uncharacterized membrane-anchored protein YjiN (DUF445 family)